MKQIVKNSSTGSSSMDTIKKKILYVVTQTEWGGAQKYVYELATSQIAKNYEIVVAVADNPDKALITRLEAKNIKVYTLKHLKRHISPLADFLAIFELKKLYLELKPEIIHTSSSKPSIIGSLAFRLTKKLRQTKLIHTVHGWAFNEPGSAIKKQFYLLAEKIAIKYKTLVIFISEYDKQSAIDHHLKINNSVVIYNGLALDQTVFLDKNQARDELGLDKNAVIIGTIANLYKNKGLNYFIDAINQLVNYYKIPVTGVIIGDGNDRPVLENLIANYNLSNHFKILGKRDNASRYLKAYDIYISSSLKEGLPYSIMESMLAKKPIVATNIGGIPEMIIDKQNGLLIEPANYKQLADSIKSLIENFDLAGELATQAETTVKEKFSLKNMTTTTFDQYK